MNAPALRYAHFQVFGIPGPQGSKVFKGLSKSGKGIMVESSKKVAPWREAVAWAAVKARGQHAPMDGPLLVSMVFTLPKPTSAPKRARTYPMRKPDLSKLIRSTEDALVTSGLIADDARIVGFLRTMKVYPGEGIDSMRSPGAVITVSALTEGT